MPVTVNVPGVGRVNFPDGMSEEQIAAEVEKMATPMPSHGGASGAPMKGLLPTAGSFVGSALGTLAGPFAPVARVAGAGVGGALGKGAELLLDDKPDSVADSLKAMGLEGATQAAYETAGGVAGKALKTLGSGLYKGGVELLPRTLKEANPNIAATGLREGIALTKRGAEAADAAVKASRANADAIVAAAERAGVAPVSARDVIRELRPVRDTLEKRADLGLADDVPALANRAKVFAGRAGRHIPLTRAQALKREAQDMADTAFRAQERGAVIKSDEALTNKALAKGLRKGIAARVPAVDPVNARTRELAGLREAAEHASGTGHILSRLGSGGVAAGLASGSGLAPAIAAAAGGAALGTPGGLTATGVGIRKVAPMVSHVPEAIRAAMLLELLSGGETQ